MNKKLIVLIAVVIVVLGVYGCYYAYAAAYLIPEDINLLKDEIKTINESGTYDDEIAGLERQADRIENSSLLQSVSLTERQKQANNLKNGPTVQSINETLNELKQNITSTKNMALNYDLLLMGDIADGLESAYNDEMVDTLDSMDPLMDRLADDLRDGSNKAVAADLRELADKLKIFNKQEQISVDNLQNVVNKLEYRKQWLMFNF